eukprot:CAMPEP_0113467404 /NCGR_PEP_ID=MMETSP0014_2-20120614/14797_1 /TAXON_ID=2857 /ORGANISM="Nitzschia sp." /LENGTH=785 /DNA_ID=CAMNT_0000359711 /DNA_START=139 /DNA_END=2496 /DNA_ORIENTATION=- /assembly_acc=CAM_ASM_000159
MQQQQQQQATQQKIDEMQDDDESFHVVRSTSTDGLDSVREDDDAVITASDDSEESEEEEEEDDQEEEEEEKLDGDPLTDNSIGQCNTSSTTTTATKNARKLPMSTDVITMHILQFLGDDRSTWNRLQLACPHVRRAIVDKHHDNRQTTTHCCSSIPWPKLIHLPTTTCSSSSSSSSSSSPEDVRCMAFTDQYYKDDDMDATPRSRHKHHHYPTTTTSTRRHQLLALASFSKIMVYDVQRGLVCVLTEVYGWIKSLQFSPDGMYLVAIGSGWLDPIVYKTSSFYTNSTTTTDCERTKTKYIQIPLQQAVSLGTGTGRNGWGWDGRNSIARRIQQLGWFDGNTKSNNNDGGCQTTSSSSSSSGGGYDTHHESPYRCHLWFITQDNTLWNCDVETGECSRTLYWGPRRWFCKLLTVIGRKQQLQHQEKEEEEEHKPQSASDGYGPDLDRDVGGSQNTKHSSPETNTFWSIVKFEGCLKLVQCRPGQHAHGQAISSSSSSSSSSRPSSVILHDHADACGMKYFDFSPCRQHLVAGGDHGLVQVWFNVVPSDDRSLPASSSSKSSFTPAMTKHRLSGLQAAVKSVTFSPDGQLLAALDAIGIIMIWRVDDIVHLSTSSSVTTTSNGSRRSATRFFSTPCSFVRYENKGSVSSSSSSSCSRNHDCSRRRRRRETRRDGGHLNKKRHTDHHPDHGCDGNDNETTAKAVAGRGGNAGVVGVHSIAFTPDSRMLSAASTDGKVRFWSRAKWGMNPSSLLYFCHDDDDDDDDDSSSSGSRRCRTDSFSTFLVDCQ